MNMQLLRFQLFFLFLLYELSAIRNFLVSDILLFFLFLVGITVLFKTRTKISLIWFVLFSIVLLEIIYHKINPDMQRYLTHLIPFLLIPASYGFYYILRFGYILFRIAIIVVLLFQIQT